MEPKGNVWIKTEFKATTIWPSPHFNFLTGETTDLEKEYKEALVEHCNHQVSQAEQCALIVHTKGKCSVKNGSFEELKPICEALLMEGLTAEIF
jgi:hypothetical protein